MGKSRAEQAMAVGAETLTTVCPTCELTLRAGAKAAENGSKLKVSNMLDLIWKAIK
jgi:Fe-S oxidoreductase